MENWWIRQPKVYSLIRVLFILLATVTLSIIILTLVLNVHETVKFYSGELLSTNPPFEYKSPYEAMVDKVLVVEGDFVGKGDTLVILRNETLFSEYQSTKEDYFLAQVNFSLLKKQLEMLEMKMEESAGGEGLISSELKYNRKQSNIAISSLRKQITSMEEKLRISEDRLEKDRQLYSDGIISQVEFQSKKQNYLDQLNQLSALKKQYQQQLSSKKYLSSDYSGKMKQFRLETLSQEQELIELKKTVFQQEASLDNLENRMEFLGSELHKLTIIAENDGYAFNLFNEKQISNYIAKGIPLVRIRPLEDETFYAKVKIAQESVSKIRSGQPVHLKVKAYNFYQYGIVKGKVSHIGQKDTSNQFYVIVDIPDEERPFELKSGYKVKGDIILEKVKLYRFMARKMLKKH